MGFELRKSKSKVFPSMRPRQIALSIALLSLLSLLSTCRGDATSALKAILHGESDGAGADTGGGSYYSRLQTSRNPNLNPDGHSLWFFSPQSTPSRSNGGDASGVAGGSEEGAAGQHWNRAGASEGVTSAGSGRESEKEDHPLLRHHDEAARDRFGSPVVASSKLPFSSSPEKQAQIHVRSVKQKAQCPASTCPRAAACPNGDGLDFATCSPEGQGGDSPGALVTAPGSLVTAPGALVTVVVLRDVFVNNEGVVFNSSTIFNFDDCTLGTPEHPMGWHSHRRGAPVVHLTRAVSLVHHWGRNFFHSMLEVLPMFFALAPFLRQDPAIPILMKENLYREYERYGEQVTGVRASHLNVVFPLHHRVQVFAKELIQPHFPPCMEPDGKLISALRQHYFLKSPGLPFLTPALQPRSTGPLSEEEMAKFPGSWKVVLMLRPWGFARSLKNEDRVVKALLATFGDRVLVLRKNLPIVQAMALFQATRLLVSVHGGALTNMVFLPQGSFVFEFRLLSYDLPLYQKMAERTGLQYYRSYAKGTKGTMAEVNMTDFSRQMEAIKKAM